MTARYVDDGDRNSVEEAAGRGGDGVSGTWRVLGLECRWARLRQQRPAVGVRTRRRDEELTETQRRPDRGSGGAPDARKGVKIGWRVSASVKGVRISGSVVGSEDCVCDCSGTVPEERVARMLIDVRE